MTDREKRIRETLLEAFSPRCLEIADDSARHAGHAGAAPGGETHFNVHIVADAFAGMSRVERQRAVNRALAAEFGRGLHALSIRAEAPEE